MSAQNNFISMKINLPLVDLCKLLPMYTENIQLLFYGGFYHPIDGVAMGSPLVVVLTDIMTVSFGFGLSDR